LVSLVDQQLPQEPRTDDPRRLRRHVPAEHHEPDRCIVRVDRAIPRVALGYLLCIAERLGHCPDEAPLRRRDLERDHLVAIRICDRAEADAGGASQT
jgi:hypothetical protein